MPVGEIKASIAVAGSRYPAHVVLIREVSGHLVSVFLIEEETVFFSGPYRAGANVISVVHVHTNLVEATNDVKNDTQIMCSSEHKPGNK